MTQYMPPGWERLRSGAMPSADRDVSQSQIRDPGEVDITITELERSDRGLIAELKAGKRSGRPSTFHR